MHFREKRFHYLYNALKIAPGQTGPQYYYQNGHVSMDSLW